MKSAGARSQRRIAPGLVSCAMCDRDLDEETAFRGRRAVKLDDEVIERCAKAGYGAIEHLCGAEWEERDERKREAYRAVVRDAIEAFVADDPVRRVANGVMALWDGAGGIDVDDWAVAIDALRVSLAAGKDAP